MALLKYFKRTDVKKQTKVESVLPKSDGSLSLVMPMSSIEAANAAVRHVMMKAPKVKENEEMNCDEEVVPVPVLTTPTAYKSWTFLVSRIHSNSSPSILLHMSLYTWCPRTTESNRSVSISVSIEAARGNMP